MEILTEQEVTLIIASDHPEEVSRQIADLPRIAAYRLVPRETIAIHDIHFDTPERILEANRLALRIREIAGSIRLSFKGPSQQLSAVARQEIEEPWSMSAISQDQAASRYSTSGSREGCGRGLGGVGSTQRC